MSKPTPTVLTGLLRAKLPGKRNWQGVGEIRFLAVPREGEFVMKKVDGVDRAFRVVTVMFPEEPVGDHACDVYAVQVGSELNAMDAAFQQAPEAK